jgi:outer membrane biosynthesis protein TonB
MIRVIPLLLLCAGCVNTPEVLPEPAPRVPAPGDRVVFPPPSAPTPRVWLLDPPVRRETEADPSGLRRLLPLLRRCYDRMMRRDPSLHGRLVIELRIGNDGAVVSAHIVESTLDHPSMTHCLLATFRRARFAPHRNPTPQRLKVPLVLKQS